MVAAHKVLDTPQGREGNVISHGGKFAKTCKKNTIFNKLSQTKIEIRV